MRNPQPSPLAGMFKHPCGAWVRGERFASGAIWWRPCVRVTRSGVFGLGYSVEQGA